MDFTQLPIAALPEPAAIPAAPLPAPQWGEAATGPKNRAPLAVRLTLNPTITAKANYYDLAGGRRPPFDLRSSLIWLCLCAHDNSVWWEPRAPDHEDGAGPPPLPLALDFPSWMRYIQGWQSATFAPNEEAEIEALAIRVWLGAHETVCVPGEDGDTKKNATPPLPTGLSSTPTSSAEAMPPAGTTCSSGCRSEPSTPSSTHGSAPAESPASALPNPPAGTPK